MKTVRMLKPDRPHCLVGWRDIVDKDDGNYTPKAAYAMNAAFVKAMRRAHPEDEIRNFGKAGTPSLGATPHGR